MVVVADVVAELEKGLSRDVNGQATSGADMGSKVLSLRVVAFSGLVMK